MPWVKPSESGPLHLLRSKVDRRLAEPPNVRAKAREKLYKRWIWSTRRRGSTGSSVRQASSISRALQIVGQSRFGRKSSPRPDGYQSGENRPPQEPWRAPTAVEYLDAPEGYSREESESTTGQRSTASREWKRSSPRPDRARETWDPPGGHRDEGIIGKIKQGTRGVMKRGPAL